MEYVISIGAVLIALYILYMSLKDKDKGQNWEAVPGSKTEVIVKDPDGNRVKVQLPKGQTTDTIDQVHIGTNPRQVEVTIKHEKTNRRGAAGSTDHDMGI